ncbi:major facilitator superfamily transporter [Plectosphaerella plurivora]|uniref:Major facilitator superfamily transporter n=1 Tax=Plectosphaerella plurivora TaxID=936078 RepID=A0A9P8V1Q7_9PEZI|nr:major facilitator superfamily transporter [Plectosphaerella plurivora]
MENRKSFLQWATYASRRFTTIEGWQEVQSNVYKAAGAGLQFITVDPEFDPEQHHEDASIRTRSSARTSSRLSPRQLKTSDGPTLRALGASGPTANPFDDRHLIAPFAFDFRDPFADSCTTEPVSVPEPVEQDYHIFTRRQKWLVILIIGGAGLFSGLSSNIYFPALQQIANDLKVSLGTVSLTITSYLIIQGVAPLFWGTLSDTLGRRPIYLASFTAYIIANIGLSFSPNFTALFVLRGLQAAGIASTVSMGNGVIQDISPLSERAAFISFYQAIRNFSIAIGPVLGGLLSNFLGFRSIFIFLLALSTVATIMIVFLLPETLRSIAGNGSIRLRGIYSPLIYKITKEPDYWEEPDEPIIRPKLTPASFLEPFRLLAQGDIFASLLFGGVVYAIWSMVTASTTGLFKARFGLNELLIGLAFLPNGFGTIVGSAIIGNLMTQDFRAAEAAYKAERNMPDTAKISAKKVPNDFPIEQARLRHLPWVSGVFIGSTAAYGLSLALPNLTALPGWIAIPLILQFFIAAASNAIFALNQTLVSDLCPGRGASSTAINNLVRCGVGAIGVALIEGMLAILGPAPTFLGLALIVVIFSPLSTVNLYWGMQLRTRRAEKQAVREGKKKMGAGAV